ncbi:MAG: cytochrome c biogenesis protein CcsA [Desulfobacterales bacterium]|nr:cytochrome c biogenesis protein CcsA [Desulfobacterales bacterium]
MLVGHGVIIISYLLSTWNYLSYLFFQKDKFHEWGYRWFMIGFVGLTGLIAFQWYQIGHLPVHNLQGNLWCISWSLSFVFLLLNHRLHLKVLGSYTAPFVLVLMIISACVPVSGIQVQHNVFVNIWLVFHVVLTFAGESALCLAFGVGFLYLVQERTIKYKRNRFFLKRLPSLEQLDYTGYNFVVYGFVLLTIGLLAGLVYAKAIWGHFIRWDIKEIWTGISWLIYAVLLHGRVVAGWRGHRSAVMAMIGFLILIFTFFGVNFLLTGHHGTFTQF